MHGKLLRLENPVKATPHPATTQIKEFKNMLDEVENPVRHLAYIYHMNNPDSSYSGYNDKVREEEVKNDLYGDREYEIPEVVKTAEEKYVELTTTPEERLLRSAVNSIYSLIDYLDEFDPTERDKNDKLVWSTKDYIRNMEKLSSVVETVKDLREKVEKGEKAQGDVRGGVDLTEYNKGER